MIRCLPLYMIALGSNDNSDSFSASQAYNARTLRLISGAPGPGPGTLDLKQRGGYRTTGKHASSTISKQLFHNQQTRLDSFPQWNPIVCQNIAYYTVLCQIISYHILKICLFYLNMFISSLPSITDKSLALTSCYRLNNHKIG